MQSILASCSTILLLGEANFSFSVSLKKMLPDTVAMVTSCFQSREQLPRDDGHVETNIASLSDLGAQVLFGVDATKLTDQPELLSTQFDAVVFNFPHVGGKGNIGRNRDLLKQFFKCCSKILTPHGTVLVTLCNGQGGTPADQPQRKWHDSWQIVAMSTYGSFILTQTVPFIAQDYEEYYCTGYRSQSKQFRTRDAVTHIFERSAPAVPECSATIECSLLRLQRRPDGSSAVDCPPDLARHIEKNLLDKRNNPLHHLSQELCRILKPLLPDGCTELKDERLPLAVTQEQATSVGDKLAPSALYILDQGLTNTHTSCSTEVNSTPSVVDMTEETMSTGCSMNSDCVERPQGSTTSQPNAADSIACTHHRVVSSDEGGNESEESCHKNVCNMCSLGSSSCNVQCQDSVESDKVVLRPSLLCHMPQLVSKQPASSGCVTFGRVFRRCGISITQYPIMHQCLVVFPSCTSGVASFESCTQKSADALSSLLGGRGKVSLQECKCDSDGVNPKTSLVAEMEEPNQFDQSTVCIGQCGVYHSSQGGVPYSLLNLDHIAMIMYDIKDIRLLWSSDERNFSRFQNSCTREKTKVKGEISDPITTPTFHNYSIVGKSHSKDQHSASKSSSPVDSCTVEKPIAEGEVVKLKTSDTFFGYSLYPPAYSHDVSFWLKDDSFDELLFCSVVRSVTFDLVREVCFLNQYINQRVSYTYRLVYQSCDGAQTKVMSNDLQNNLRAAIDQWLAVETR